MKQLSGTIPVVKSLSKNDCGPCSVSSVLGFFASNPPSPQVVAKEMGLWRIPFVGATLPWGINHVLRKYELETAGGLLGTVDAIKNQIDLDRPVIVLVRPTDLHGLPFYSLHYRVVVGYNDRAARGDGELYFNCSAAPLGKSLSHPGNLAVDYDLFRRQWLTYCSINWYAAAYPREA